MESARTLIYATVAAAAVGGAWVTHYMSQPTPVAGFERVGEDFFEAFEDPTLAKSLKVVAFDEDTASVREFEVKQQASGEWVIPSRHDYPADGEDRLAKTAASIIGIKRGALASRYEDDYENYGVIDPEDEDGSKLTGRGQRITLKDNDGEVLADYIIGKKVENPTGHYYVRVPGEKETYISKFEVDLSTKFTDWIDDDLLNISQSDLVELTVDNYSIDERGALGVEETNVLKREKSSDPWKLDGLKEETEELKTSEISTMVSTLDSLKAVGVRPKPKGIDADLTVPPEISSNRLLLDALQGDLAARGFRIGPKRNGEEGIRLYANEGELTASTNTGISYVLRFGEIFTGTQDEIETGFVKDAADTEKKDDKDGEQEVDPPDTQRSRYLFVSAKFDERFLGEKPVKPTEPPEFEDDDADAGEKKADDKAAGEDEAGDTADEKDDKADEKTDGKEETDEKDDASAAAREAYEAQLRKYESDQKAFEKKIEDGKSKAKELNDRFAAWYYVISIDSFEKLRLSRDAMVKAKEKPTEDKSKESDIGSNPAMDAAKDAMDPPPPAKNADKDADASEAGESTKKATKEPEPKPADKSEKPSETPAKEDKPIGTSPADEPPAKAPKKSTESPDSGKEQGAEAKPTEPPPPKTPEPTKKPAKPDAGGSDPDEPR